MHHAVRAAFAALPLRRRPCRHPRRRPPTPATALTDLVFAALRNLNDCCETASTAVSARAMFRHCLSACRHPRRRPRPRRRRPRSRPQWALWDVGGGERLAGVGVRAHAPSEHENLLYPYKSNGAGTRRR